MKFSSLLKKVTRIFGNEELHALFLKLGEVELTPTEQTIITNWINLEEGRPGIYLEIKKLLAFRKRVSLAVGPEIKIVLNDLKKCWPGHFSEIPENLIHHTLKIALAAYLDQFIWELSYKIVYGKRASLIIACIVRLALVILAILIILQICTK